MPKIFISTIPFGEVDPAPIELLRQTGWEFTINPLGRKLKADEVADIAMDADGIIAGTEDLRRLIQNSSKLKMISRVGIGLDSVPLEACKQRGIMVSYTPDAVTLAVAEMTIGGMISITRHLALADTRIRQGKWKRLMGKRIGESIIGLIGFGRIGYQVARLLTPFSPQNVLVNDLLDKSAEISQLVKMGLNIRHADKEAIYQQADIISLHVPYSKQTHHLISQKTLKLFRKDSFLLNFARGGIVNEGDLYQGLQKGWIKGAVIDVFEEEPYAGELTKLENVLMTQHMGSCSYDCRSQMERRATEEIIRYFNGEDLQNAVPAEEYRYQAEF